MRAHRHDSGPLGTAETVADAPRSDRGRLQPLSRTLWGLDWSAHLPAPLPGGITVHASDYDRSLPFIREHYAAIFEEDPDSPFSTSRLTAVKERYYRVAGDFFELTRSERTVGLMVCTLGDWSTYYIRSAALLPECQGFRAMEGLVSFILPHLSAVGVERVEVDIGPQNVASASGLRKQGFHVSGTILTDRWGAHSRLTRFLEPEREEIFLRQFCSGVRPRQRAPSGAPPSTQGPERSSP